MSTDQNAEPFKINITRLKDLPPLNTDPLMAKIEEKHLTVFWGGYEYAVELERIKTPDRALAFIAHIVEKDWKDMTPDRVSRLIRKLQSHFKWPTQF